MKKYALALSLLSATLGIGSVNAMADTFTFSFSGPSDSGSGTITANATSTPGEYNIVGITGVTDGLSIAGLLPVNSYPSDYAPLNDNLLFYPNTGSGYVDESGTAYDLSNGEYIDLFFGGFENLGTMNYIVEGVGQTVDELSGLSVKDTTVTPEPGTLLLLGTGMLGAMAMVRRRLAA